MSNQHKQHGFPEVRGPNAARHNHLAFIDRVRIEKTATPREFMQPMCCIPALDWAVLKVRFPELISPEAQHVIDVARAHGAIGWKVNGAGGYGGSLTILGGPLSHAKRRMIREIEQDNTLNKNIPIYLSRFGLRTWEQGHQEKR